MPEAIESLINALFIEPVGLDDCLDIGKILTNSNIDLEKDIDIYNEVIDKETNKAVIDAETKEPVKIVKRIRDNESLNLYVSHEREILGAKHKIKDYLGHYRIHSNTAIDVLDYFIKNSAEKTKVEYLENKIVNFFNSFEWEIWAWKYVDANSEPLTYNAPQENNRASGNTSSRRRRK